MITKKRLNGKEISAVGIGGHYARMEEGEFEERWALVGEDEVARRADFIREAIDQGVTYFDTTWRNEVEMLARTLRGTGLRDRLHINGMVLGAFRGSRATGMDPVDYFAHWLEEHLRCLGGPFDSMMINAIEEDYDQAVCEDLVAFLQKRRDRGDFATLGFSCHNPAFARALADRFPAFSLIMVPYNFHNRAFEPAFADYQGGASFVAMKPLIWLEYGIPFAALNDLPRFEALFGFPPDPQIVRKAYQFVANHPKIMTVLSSVNTAGQARMLAEAGQAPFDPKDAEILQQYADLQSYDGGLALFLGATVREDSRMNHFAIENLRKILGAGEGIPLNTGDTRRLQQEAIAALRGQAGEKYGL